MVDLNKFLKENKENIHELLNHMWYTIERIAIRFEDAIPNVDLDNSHGNYIKIDQGWSESVYANPSIVFPFGEFGYSLDGLFCVFSIDPSKFTEDLLVKIVELSREKDAISFELYGGDDCFQTFFQSKFENDFDSILDAIEKTEEATIQLELSIEAVAEESIKEDLIETSIHMYNLLQEGNCLVNLPNYSNY